MRSCEDIELSGIIENWVEYDLILKTINMEEPEQLIKVKQIW